MEEDIRQALETLRNGGLILYPTDTIWGIGCDPTRPESVGRIFELKRRAEQKSMLILVESANRLYTYVNDVPGIAIELIEVADKPLTIIYPGARNLASNLLAEDGSIGIRVCNDPFCSKLLQRFRKPLVSTSANLHGHPSPAWFGEIQQEIINGVDYVVKWRQDDRRPSAPSQLIWLGKGGEIKILRK